jgi:cytochrome c peroxidase
MKSVIGLIALGVTWVAGYSAIELPAPVTDADYYEDGAIAPEKVELGRLLFFDKVLSGNRNISCATCHHPDLATTDGLALGLGEGPDGLGPDRRPGADVSSAVHNRIPRNSPALFNLGAREFTRMFLDGRVETDPNGYYEGGFVTPAKWKLPTGLENVLAAQAMFPVASPDEMAGQKGENGVANAVSLNNAAGAGGVWETLAKRLQEIPEYVDLFKAAFPDQVESADDITYVLAANAIGAFEAQAFRADDSPFDRYLRGSRESLSDQQLRGLELFYGKAGCAGCHAGKFQTDHEFHAIAMPQIGPGKADGSDADY